MLKLYAFLKTFGADRKGATAIEYGLIAAGIAVVIIGAVQGLGGQLTTMFGNVAAGLGGGGGGGGG